MKVTTGDKAWRRGTAARCRCEATVVGVAVTAGSKAAALLHSLKRPGTSNRAKAVSRGTWADHRAVDCVPLCAAAASRV